MPHSPPFITFATFTALVSRPGFTRVLKIGFSIACLFFIWQWMDRDKLALTFKNLALLPFGIAVLFNLMHKMINAIKIRLLFPTASHASAPALENLIAINFIAVFFRAFLPGVVGGELARWTYLGQEPGSKNQAIAVILLDRVTGLWAQIFSALGAWLWLSKNSVTLWIAGPVALAVLLVSLWAGLWGYRNLILGFVHLGAWYARKQSKVLQPQAELGQALIALLATRQKFWKIVILSLVSHSLVILTFLLIDRSIQGQLEPAHATLLLFCYSLVLLLPIAFGNWGLSEGTLGLLYHYAGTGGSMGIAISLTLRLMDLPAVFIGWIFFLRHRKLK